MKTTAIAAVALLALTPALFAQRATIGIGEVKVNPSVQQAAAAASKALSVQRVAESMDSLLIDKFNGTRKFEIIARSDLADVFTDQAFQNSGNVDANDPRTAQQFQIKGVQYIVVTTISDFQDVTETAHFTGLGEGGVRRTIRFVASVKLYDTTKGSLLESATVNVRKRMARELQQHIQADGDLNEALITEIATELSDRVTNRVVDVIYPAKIIARTDKQVTINRGDGTGIERGQVWDVYALGEELIDPDTGEKLGSEEVKVGTVRVTDVTPKFSRAEVVEDTGVDTGAVVRFTPPAED